MEAASKIAELAKKLVIENLKEERGFCDGLKEPFQTEIIGFSDSVEIAIASEELLSVVADYMLSYSERLDNYCCRQ